MSVKSEPAHSRREEIIEIASRLFYEQGFGATGIKQIIDEAGIAKGTFYTHFESKELLGVEWLRARHAKWQGWFDEALDQLDSPAEKLLATFDFLESWLQEAEYRGCAFLNTMAETPNLNHPMRAEVAAHKKALLSRFQKIAEEHFVPRGVSAEVSREQGTTLYLLFEGALVEAQNFHDTWPIDAARSTAARILDQADLLS